MDPLSIAAGIAGFLSLSSEIINFLSLIIHDTANAPSQARTLYHEICSVQAVLNGMDTFLAKHGEKLDDEKFSIVQRGSLLHSVDGCKMALSLLQKELGIPTNNPYDNGVEAGRRLLPNSRGTSLWRNLRWARKSSTIQQTVRTLQDQKLTLTLLVSTIHTYSTTGMHNSQVLEIHTHMLSAVMDKFSRKRSSGGQEKSSVYRRLRSRKKDDGQLSSLGTVATEWSETDRALHDASLQAGIYTLLHGAAVANDLERAREIIQGIRPDLNFADESGFTPLHTAILNNAVSVAECFIDGGADHSKLRFPEKSSYSGYTCLHAALTTGGHAMVQMLLAKGADPYTPIPTSTISVEIIPGMRLTPRRNTPLICALSAGDSEMVRILVSAGVDVNGIFVLDYDSDHSYNMTPFSFAVYLKDCASARIIADAGAYTNIPRLDDADVDLCLPSPLLHALNTGNPTMVSILAETGADIRSPFWERALERGGLISSTEAFTTSKASFTPLQIAVCRRHFETVSVLQNHGADPDTRFPELSYFAGLTPLQVAVNNRDSATAKVLLGHGADSNTPFPENRGIHAGFTPLQLAVDNKDPATVNVLLEHGADPAIPFPGLSFLAGLSLLEVAVHDKDAATVKVLCDHGARTDTVFAECKKTVTLPPRYRSAFGNKDTDSFARIREVWAGFSPLHGSVFLGDEKTTQALIDAGADVQVPYPQSSHGYSGFTVLQYAVETQHAAMVKILIDNGAHLHADFPSKKERGVTAVQRAVFHRDADTVRLLVEAGADIASRFTEGDLAGCTPLEAAVLRGDNAIVKVLQGADSNSTRQNNQ